MYVVYLQTMCLVPRILYWNIYVQHRERVGMKNLQDVDICVKSTSIVMMIKWKQAWPQYLQLPPTDIAHMNIWLLDRN